jgi:hypothetical protein
MYPGSTWSNISSQFKDLSFRVEGDGTRSLPFESSLTVSTATTTVITTTAAHGRSVGDIVLSGGEVRYITTINSTTQFTVGVAFTVAPSGGFYIGQGFMIQSHLHNRNTYNATEYINTGTAGAAGSYAPGGNYIQAFTTTGRPAVDGSNGPPQVGAYTRVDNISIRLWLRMA